MLSSRKRLAERTGKFGTPRNEYIQQLISEYQETKSKEQKQQVLCHLANFAYDPINYTYLRQLHVVELFIDALVEKSSSTVEFAAGGLCNCAGDLDIQEVIIKYKGIDALHNCLHHTDSTVVTSTLTTLYLMCNSRTAKDICTKAIIASVMDLCSDSSNTQVQHLARVVLDEFSIQDSKQL